MCSPPQGCAVRHAGRAGPHAAEAVTPTGFRGGPYLSARNFSVSTRMLNLKGKVHTVTCLQFTAFLSVGATGDNSSAEPAGAPGTPLSPKASFPSAPATPNNAKS